MVLVLVVCHTLLYCMVVVVVVVVYGCGCGCMPHAFVLYSCSCGCAWLWLYATRWVQIGPIAAFHCHYKLFHPTPRHTLPHHAVSV